MLALVATTNPEWQHRFVQALQQIGCKSIVVHGGFDGLDKIEHGTFDVVVLDDTLPDMNALEFALSLKEYTRQVPLLLAAAPALARKFERIGARVPVSAVGSAQEIAEMIPLLTPAARTHPSSATIGTG